MGIASPVLMDEATLALIYPKVRTFIRERDERGLLLFIDALLADSAAALSALKAETLAAKVTRLQQSADFHVRLQAEIAALQADLQK